MISVANKYNSEVDHSIMSSFVCSKLENCKFNIMQSCGRKVPKYG